MKSFIMCSMLLLTGCSSFNRLRTDISAPPPFPSYDRSALSNVLQSAVKTIDTEICTRAKLSNGTNSDKCYIFKDVGVDDAPTLRLYLSSGFALTDDLCDTFFRSANASSRQRSFARGATNDVGGLISTILGITNAGSGITGGVGAGFSRIDSTFRNYDDSFVVTPDLAAVKLLVNAEQARLKSLAYRATFTNYADARSAILTYAEPCTFLGMKGLLNRAVLTQAQVEALSPNEYVNLLGILSKP